MANISSSRSSDELTEAPSRDPSIMEKRKLDNICFAETDADTMHRHHRRAVYLAGFGQIVLAVVLSSILFVLRLSYDESRSLKMNLIESPARSAVVYEKTMIDTNLYVKNEFIGVPTPEKDSAWENLLQYQYAAVSPSELPHDTSVKLNDPTGRVLVSLEVFNTLDCLNYLRKFSYRDHYNGTEITAAHEERATACTERIRQDLMCYGDISFSTFVWKKGRLAPFPNFRGNHECKNWDNIVHWAEEHQVPPLGDELLEHPEFGWSINPPAPNVAQTN